MLDNIDKHGFSDRIKEARLSRKLSIIEIASLLGVGRNTYAEWENKKSERLPGELNTYYRLCQLLDIGMHYLATGVSESDHDPKFVQRMSSLYHRQSIDPDFNALLILLQNAPTDVITGMLTTLLWTQEKPKKRRLGALNRRRKQSEK